MLPDLRLQRINLLVCERARERAVDDAIAVGDACGLRVRERLEQLDALDEVSGHFAYHCAHVVLVERRADPERDVLEARRELGEGCEASDGALAELGEEAGVGGPEQTDVGDVEQNLSTTHTTAAEINENHRTLEDQTGRAVSKRVDQNERTMRAVSFGLPLRAAQCRYRMPNP